LVRTDSPTQSPLTKIDNQEDEGESNVLVNSLSAVIGITAFLVILFVAFLYGRSKNKTSDDSPFDHYVDKEKKMVLNFHIPESSMDRFRLSRYIFNILRNVTLSFRYFDIDSSLSQLVFKKGKAR